MTPHDTRGTVIISYDDGVMADYTVAYPVHRTYGVPAEVCIPSSYVGMEGRLTPGHLSELQSAGWEIVSHTKHHVTLANTTLQRDAHKGDVRLYVTGHTRFKAGVELSISQGDVTELVTVTEHNSDPLGNYLLIHKPLENDYKGKDISKSLRILRRLLRHEPAHAVLCVSDQQAHTEIKTSKRELESLDLMVRHFTYPYGRYSHRTREIVSQCYDSARAGSKHSSPTEHIPDRYALRSVSFENNRISDEHLLAILEDTKIHNKLTFLHAHTGHRGFSVARLEGIIAACLRKSILISTRSEYFATA